VTSIAAIEDVGDEAEAPAPKPKRSMKLPLIAGVAALLLGGAGVGGYFWFTAKPHAESKTAASAESSPKSYVDVPAMIVNLHSSDGQAHMLKLHFMLVAAEPGKADGVKAKLPVYLDAVQPFLRELRPEDLDGSAAVYRVKEEMLSRADDAFGSGEVRDVLIQDLIQQ
jgi:flagellar protein FliL